MSTMMFEHNDASQLGLRGRSLSPTRGPSHSPARRRVPSPLRNAQFRPIAMSYAASPTTSESCQFFNASNKEEDPVGAPGGFCANVRTVGYSTVGGKTFMSGKCPHCRRIVKSDNQVCTPNASPSPSPWKLQSPLRSPIRGARSSDGRGALQSPLRSPFKGPLFGKGQSKDAEKEGTSSSSNKADSTDEDENVDSNKKPANNSSERPSGRRPRGRSQDSRIVLKSPSGRSPLASLSTRTPWRGRTLSARSSSPVRTCTSGRSTRGPRSPRPHSPMNSPWKGASFFEGPGAEVQTECINPMSRGKSRGAHSPGPRNPINPVGPLSVKVDFVSPDEEDELREAEERVAAKKQQAEGGWKSPLLSPFKGRLFGRGDKAAPLGSE